MKYIIKNCPTQPSNIKASYGWCNTKQIKCQDCTNCLLKQIVEKCMHEAHGDAWQIVRAGDVFLANDILRLLNIQEILE